MGAAGRRCCSASGPQCLYHGHMFTEIEIEINTYPYKSFSDNRGVSLRSKRANQTQRGPVVSLLVWVSSGCVSFPAGDA